MAIVQNSPLINSLRGKLGNNVFSVWKGQQIVKAYNAAPFKAPPSDKMELIQGLLLEAGLLYGGIDPAHKIVWENIAKRQKRLPIKSFPRGGVENLVPPNKSTSFGKDIFIGAYINAYLNGINDPDEWDLLIQDWNNLDGWTEAGVGTSIISPAGQLRLAPGVGNNIQRWRDIGALPAAGYTYEARTYFDDVGTIASGNYYIFNTYDSVHLLDLSIGTDKIRVFTAAAGYDEKVIATAADTWFYWRVIVDSINHKVKVWRRTAETTWAFIHEFNSMWHDATADGLCRLVMFRGGAGASESHTDYWYIGTGLGTPGQIPVPPEAVPHPHPPTKLLAAYAVQTVAAFWTRPEGFTNADNRCGLWIYGSKTTQGKVYRQRVGYQINPNNNGLTFKTFYVAVNGLQIIDDVKPVNLLLQAYNCNRKTGLMSAGSETVALAVT